MKRSTLLLTLLFLVLLVVTVFLLRPEGDKQASYELVERYLDVDSAKVMMMAIRSDEVDITFEKVGGKWLITAPLKYDADQNSVLQLLAHTRELVVKSLISENPERQSMFKVDTSGTLLVFREAGGVVDSLIIGKNAPTFSDRYVRKVGSNKVYLAGGLKAWLLGRKLKDWRDKTIVDMPRESIQRVAVTLSKESYILEKRGERWFVGQDSTQEIAVNSFIAALSPLRADDFIDSSVAIPKKPSAQLEVAGDQTVALQFFPTPTDTLKYWVASSTSPQVYQVSRWSAKRFMKSRNEFVK
ncbi:MAG: DUF4340 domain-containing protein [Bacteroidota bacterium]